MDTPGITEPILPKDWELQSLRQTFRGRTIDLLPEAWELRCFPKSVKGNICRNYQTREEHHESDVQMELLMLLTIRCLQRSEIEDFSIAYQAEKPSSITIKYTTAEDKDHEKSLNFLLQYVPENSANKRIFKQDIIKLCLDILPQSNVFADTILFTNMEWKQKSLVLEKLNFQSRKTRETFSELQNLSVTANCYRVADLSQQIKDQCSEELKEFIDQDTFSRFILATEQQSSEEMRKEVQRYFENEYNLNSGQSAQLAECFLNNYIKAHPWNIYFPIKKKLALVTLEDLVEKLTRLVENTLVVEDIGANRRSSGTKHDIDEG